MSLFEWFLMFLFLVVNPACWFIILVMMPRWMRRPPIQPVTQWPNFKENPDGI